MSQKCTNPVPNPHNDSGHYWDVGTHKCDYCDTLFEDYVNGKFPVLPSLVKAEEYFTIPQGRRIGKSLDFSIWEFLRYKYPSTPEQQVPEPKCECGVNSIPGSYERHSSWCPLSKGEENV